MRAVFVGLLSLCPAFLSAQICITPYMTEELALSYPDATSVLESKLNNILSANNIQPLMGESRFILTGNWVNETKDIVSGSPVQIAYTLNINLYIGDGEMGIKYVSETFRVKGVGATEEKAHLAAIRNLQAQSTKMSKFVNEGKKRIIRFYEDNKHNLLASINSLIAGEHYDEAIYRLCLIPMECSYYGEVQYKICDVYQHLIDDQADSLFTESKALWASNQTAEGASQVMNLVTQIDPNATCYPNVQSFIATMTARVKLIDDRNYATYQKKLAHRQEMEKLELEAQREKNRLDAETAQVQIEADASVDRKRMETVAKMYKEHQITQREKYNQAAAVASQAISASERLQSQRISAARDIATTYANSHPQTVIYRVNGWY